MQLLIIQLIMPKLDEFVPHDQTLILPPGPVIDRGRGCWSCIHWDVDAAKARWNGQRQLLLASALRHKIEGREDKANGLAKMVDVTDMGVSRDGYGLCKKGWNFKGEAPPDPQPLIHYQNLCHKWDGRTGSSLATEGKPIDLLPHELNEEFQPRPDPILVKKAQDEAAEKAAKLATKGAP